MSGYFVTLSNLASLPCIIYYQYHRKYLYSLQILFNSMFSFIHHMNNSGVYVIEHKGLFDFLDGLYSYLSIYLFSVYLMLSNHYELRTEFFIVQTILVSLVYINMGAVLVLPITSFLALIVTGFHYQKINPIGFRNPFLYVGIFLAAIDLACFFIAVTYEYNYFHGVHHLIAFNLPIVVDHYVRRLQIMTSPPPLQLESPVMTALVQI